MDAVRQRQLIRRSGQLANDLPRRDVEGIHWVIDRVDIAAGARLPDFDAAWIDQLASISLGRAEQPGDEVPQLLRLLVADGLHHEMIVPHQDVEALVEARG